jgi:hypothetical protein
MKKFFKNIKELGKKKRKQHSSATSLRVYCVVHYLIR